MLNRKATSTFTILTLIVALVLNYRYFQIGFGMFYFLPIFGVITLYPKWIVSHACCLAFPAVRIAMEYLAHSGSLSSEFLTRLAITTPVSWIIILAVTFFIIQSNSMIQRLEHLSITDNLTNAFNRRYLELYSEKLLAHSLRYNQPLCFLILDIDHFKSINDHYSHSTGDLVLKKLTQVIQRTIRKADVFVRLGGEEFALILPNTPLEEGLKLAERIRKTIQTTVFEAPGTPIPVTASIGVTQFAEGSLDRLFAQADRALYQAKANGRNQVSVL